MALTVTPAELTATALTLTTAAQPNITSVGTLTTLTVDDITINSSTISDAADLGIASGGTLTVDVAGSIILDADSGGDILLKDGGTDYGKFSILNGDWVLTQPTANKDILFKGNDGNAITALRLDMSEAGNAHFNQHAYFVDNGYVVLGAGEDVKIHSDGTNGTIATQNGNLTVDVAGEIILDADAQGSGNGILLKDAGLHYGSIFRSSSHLHLKAETQDKNLLFLTNNGGSELTAMTIQSDGKVGIGEASPDNALHIKGSGFNAAHIKVERTDVGSSNDAALVLKAAAGANDAYGLGGIWFQNALDTNAYVLIRGRTDDSSGTSGKLEFVTSASAVGNATTPSMVIKSDGKVGIGETSPASKLHITTGNSTGEIRLSTSISHGSSGGTNNKLSFYNTASSASEMGSIRAVQHNQYTYGNIDVYVNNANSLALNTRFHYHGHVTINTATTASNSKLNVNGGIRFTENPASAGGLNVVSSQSFNNSNTANNCGSVYYRCFVINIYHNNGNSQCFFVSNGGGGVGFNFTGIVPGNTSLVTGTGVNFSFTTIGSAPNSFTIDISSGGGVLTVNRTSGTNSFQVSVSRLG